MQCCRRLDARFVTAALRFEARLNHCSLLGIPAKRWRFVVVAIYVHLALAATTFSLGTVCFCLGAQFSSLYNEVACSDGAALFVPLQSTVCGVFGALAIRAVQFHWLALLWLLSLFVVTASTLGLLVDSTAAAIRWFAHSRDAQVEWNMELAGTRIKLWAGTFCAFDAVIASLCAVQVVITVFLCHTLVSYWWGWRRQTASNNAGNLSRASTTSTNFASTPNLTTLEYSNAGPNHVDNEGYREEEEEEEEEGEEEEDEAQDEVRRSI